MYRNPIPLVLLGCFTILPLLKCPALADTLEVQSNTVANGQITIDGSRSDWDGVPWYEVDEDDIEFFPIDIDAVQVAHDDANLYFRVTSLSWEVEDTFRVGLYIDTDIDTATGYNGNFLAVGSDFFVEDTGLYRFTGPSPAEWGWELATEVARDQSDLKDFELSVPRSAIGNPTELDFMFFANNFCCDFQEPDDVYPNSAGALGGDFFTYELPPSNGLPGDFDTDGSLGQGDIDLLVGSIISGGNGAEFDLTNDGTVDASDLQYWVSSARGTWLGDANLDGEFNSSDLVGIFTAGKFEQDVDASWAEGDWNADRRFGTGDLVAAFGDGGFEVGPRAATAAVPEPIGTTAIVLGLLGMLLTRRS